VLLAAGLLTACVSPVGEEQRQEVITALASEVYQPAYGQLATSAEAMAGALQAYCAGTGDVAAPRAAWNQTRDDWLATRAFRFGPVGDARLAPDIDFAIDPTKVEAAAAGGEDAAALGTDARGLGAVELLLFSEEPPEPGSPECDYLVSASGVITATAATAADGWGEYTGELIAMDSQDAVELAVNGISATLDELVMMYLPDDAQATPAQRVDRDVDALYGSIDRAYFGGGSGGVGTLVAAASSGAGEDTSAAIQALGVAVPAVQPAEVTGRAEAMEAAIEARRLVQTVVTSVLSTALLLGDSDGDS
jgi:hypothetical protein